MFISIKQPQLILVRNMLQ